MSSYVCLDSSVLIKLLTWEEGSDAAAELMEEIAANELSIVLPSFAWAEIGSVLRQKALRKEIMVEEAEESWRIFRRLRNITYMDDEEVMNTAWQISTEEKLSTLYDASYLAVAETVTKQSNEVCELWTADKRLVNSLKGKEYVKLLRNFEKPLGL
ncbi:PilT protein domain protein [Desulfofarcimen acetoxidans DSM 771]|uniref:PilT protein domain protein n=1 Tax=Desulfofarcimen acetoxidans (strain ATCC 49208 / DSM 771 / KCTC 5769 / VKM B-1644 / 5575) TaxID=485916 RepID=C8W6N8_DESAS|nr:type II toxin-antitoxin system VapC family toxin [Desulfofarcimen acetoxidans]ACV64147.1 PilT protein domain protein [Desulfofarcimen acetoxidans DSM 771]